MGIRQMPICPLQRLAEEDILTHTRTPSARQVEGTFTRSPPSATHFCVGFEMETVTLLSTLPSLCG